MKLLIKELPSLKDVGPQSCLTFSVDGSKLATGGVVRKNLLSSSWNSFFFLLSSFSKTGWVYFDIKLPTSTEWTSQNLGVAKLAPHFR